jgi:predicted DNA-binding transcriptional regulator YafY
MPEDREKAGVKDWQAEHSRTARLIKTVQEIRNELRQSLSNLLGYLGISRSQFYKDKEALAAIGFKFSYHRARGFEISEDKLTPVTGFSLSDRLILMFALEHLSSMGEAHLAARAVEVGRKLAGGLEEPFKSHLLGYFDHMITRQNFGVNPNILAALQEAVNQGRRIKIYYQRSEDWSVSWREIDPRRIYLRVRNLYLYARTADETPGQWKVFRLSRIKDLQPTGMRVSILSEEDDGFQRRMKNAFAAVMGDEVKSVSIRFSGNARHYVKENIWHHSQQIAEQADGSLILTVTVADPGEVVRWARQFGPEAQLVKKTPKN